MADAVTVVSGVGLAVGGIVWLVRLEGRVNLGEERFANLKADIQEIKNDVKSLLIHPPKA